MAISTHVPPPAGAPGGTFPTKWLLLLAPSCFQGQWCLCQSLTCSGGAQGKAWQVPYQPAVFPMPFLLSWLKFYVTFSQQTPFTTPKQAEITSWYFKPWSSPKRLTWSTPSSAPAFQAAGSYKGSVGVTFCPPLFQFTSCKFLYHSPFSGQLDFLTANGFFLAFRKFSVSLRQIHLKGKSPLGWTNPVRTVHSVTNLTVPEVTAQNEHCKVAPTN